MNCNIGEVVKQIKHRKSKNTQLARNVFSLGILEKIFKKPSSSHPPTQVAMLDSFSLKKTKTLATETAAVGTVTFQGTRTSATMVQMSQQPPQ